MHKSIFLLLVATCLFAHVQAQVWPVIPSPSVVNTTGGVINQSGGGFVEFSVGETFVATNNFLGNTTFLTEGFLQPRTTAPFIIPTQEQFDELYGFGCFPNPVSDFLSVETSYHGFTNVEFANTEGQVVRSVRFDYTPIDCQSLPAGVYFVRLFSNNFSISKNFKLVKQ